MGPPLSTSAVDEGIGSDASTAPTATSARHHDGRRAAAPPKGAGRSLRRGLLSVVLGAAPFLLLGGCSRKAPGPEECEDLATRWAQQDAERVAARAGGRLRWVVSEQAVAERAQVCLTTPFDKELIECARRGLPVQSCLLRFRDRRHRELGTEP